MSDEKTMVVLGRGVASGCAGEAPSLPVMTGLGSSGAQETEDAEGTGSATSPSAPTSEEGSMTPTAGTTPEPMAECGNEIVEDGEECDGMDWQGATCESLGFAGGVLECGNECDFDTSGCSVCGDGVVAPGEECDDSNQIDFDGCDNDCTVSSGAVDVVTGDEHACALFHTGQIKCWGNFGSGAWATSSRKKTWATTRPRPTWTS